MNRNGSGQRRQSRAYTDAVRASAVGKWTSILIDAGFPSEVLDGRHHPCPKCGGTDRFRLIDEEQGACYCNQCFARDNGDGFAAIKWFTGREFTEVRDQVGKYLGIESNGSNGAYIDPEKDLDWRPWSRELAKFFLQAKPGVTEAAILAAGGRMARYKNMNTVIAFPIIGESLDTTKVVGWVLLNAMGGVLPKWDKEGNELDPVKVKLTRGSKPGLIGLQLTKRQERIGDEHRERCRHSLLNFNTDCFPNSTGLKPFGEVQLDSIEHDQEIILHGGRVVKAKPRGSCAS